MSKRPLILTVMLVLALTARAEVEPIEPTASARLEGTWNVTVHTPDGDVTNIAAFTRDGSFVNIDPDPNLSTAVGRWARIRGSRYGITFVHFLSDAGVPIGTLKVRATLDLDTGGESFSGAYTVDVVIGGTLVQTICGTVDAVRMEVEERAACP